MAEDRSPTPEKNEEVSGLVSHIEFLCEDPSKSAAFYENVFGWQITRYQLEGQEYIGWTNPEGGVPGGFRHRKNGSGERGVINYVKTFNIDGALKYIEKKGGRITCHKRHIPEVGWIARFIDPFGNLLGLFQPNEENRPR